MMKLIKIFYDKDLEEGAIIPQYMGFAYRDICYARNIYMLIPCNIIVGLLRKIHLSLIGGIENHKSVKAFYNTVYNRGYSEGRKAALKEVK